MKNRFYIVMLLVAFLSFAGLSVRAQTQSDISARQVWEYKTFVYEIDGQRTVLYEDGKQVAGGVTPVSRAPEIGAQGWELVAITSMPTSFLESVGGTGSKSIFATKLTYVYWFKRPK